MRRFLTSLVAAGALLWTAAPAPAVQPDEMLDDPALEQRARDISRELRCVVCQGENIDDSNAALARDLRLLVRKRLVDGDTDQQAMDYIVARYGEFVLLKPPFKIATGALWLAPALFLGLAAWGWRRKCRRPNAPAPGSAALSPKEQARLKALMAKTETDHKGADA